MHTPCRRENALFSEDLPYEKGKARSLLGQQWLSGRLNRRPVTSWAGGKGAVFLVDQIAREGFAASPRAHRFQGRLIG